MSKLYLTAQREEATPIFFATLPYPLPQRTLMRALRQFACIIRILLTEYRTTWFYHVFFGALLPIGLVFFFTLVDPSIAPRRALYLLTGNMATSIAYGPTQMLISKLGWGHQSQEFDYWAALPIPQLALILAIVFVYVLFAIPGLVASYMVGCWLLNLPISNGLALLPVVPLAALSMTGLGAFLGSYAKDGQTATIYGQLLMGTVTFLAPAMVPPETLPPVMQIFGWFMPTTYVAATFRAVLQRHYDLGLISNLLFLLVFAFGFLVLAQRKLDWRSR